MHNPELFVWVQHTLPPQSKCSTHKVKGLRLATSHVGFSIFRPFLRNSLQQTQSILLHRFCIIQPILNPGIKRLQRHQIFFKHASTIALRTRSGTSPDYVRAPSIVEGMSDTSIARTEVIDPIHDTEIHNQSVQAHLIRAMEARRRDMVATSK